MKLAILVGINKYGNGNDLPASVQTARQWGRWLKSQGFVVTELYESQATTIWFENALHKAYNQKPQTLVISWNGHAGQVKSGNQLVPVLIPFDAIADRGRAYSAAAWQYLLAQRPPETHLFQNLDVCFSGAFHQADAQSKYHSQFLPDVPTVKLVTNEMHSFHATKNYVGFSPCAANQESVQLQIGNVWCALETVMLQKAGMKGGTYQHVFEMMKSLCYAHYPQATPQLFGDRLSTKFLS